MVINMNEVKQIPALEDVLEFIDILRDFDFIKEEDAEYFKKNATQFILLSKHIEKKDLLGVLLIIMTYKQKKEMQKRGKK